MDHPPIYWATLSVLDLLMMLRGHTYCCGSECRLFHLVSLWVIHCIEHWLLVHYHPFVFSVFTRNVETAIEEVRCLEDFKVRSDEPYFVSAATGPYWPKGARNKKRRTLFCLIVKSLVVCCSFLGSCNWEPGWGVPGCRGGLRSGCCLFLFFFQRLLY